MKKVSPKVSVVIPTFNSWETLDPCIQSILDQTLQPFEIMVVDNASTDNTSQKVIKKYKNVKVIRMKKNTGVTGGRNAGIKYALKRSEFICFFDHDMIADKNMLAELWKTSVKDKRIGIVTGKIYYWENKNIIWSAGTDINLWTGMNVFRNGKDTGQFDQEEEIAIAPAVLFTKVGIQQKIGTFDDRFFAVYEDSEYCYRARDKGYKIYYTPHAIAYHKIPYDYQEAMKRLVTRLYWIARNRTMFMKMYGKGLVVYLLLSPVYMSYYMFLTVRYGNVSNIFSYFRGFVDGLWN